MHGPAGIVPTRGQAMALRAEVGIDELTKASWDLGLSESWFPRPVKGDSEEKPLVIIAGCRKASETRGYYDVDDSVVNRDVSRALREVFPPLFEGKYEREREPELEWVSCSFFFERPLD